MATETIVQLYFDTTCIVKLFFKEEDGASELRNFLISQNQQKQVSSELTILEFYSTIRRKLKEGDIDKNQHAKIIEEWENYIPKLELTPISKNIINRAKSLLLNAEISGRVRSLDCIHFATFQEFHSENNNTTLLTSDKGLCSMAKGNDMNYFNPLEILA